MISLLGRPCSSVSRVKGKDSDLTFRGMRKKHEITKVNVEKVLLINELVEYKLSLSQFTNRRIIQILSLVQSAE